MRKQIFSAIATSALLFQAIVPMAFAQDVGIGGNGAESTNTATVKTTNNTTAVQTNNANITNNIKTNANTGNNVASYNTGGSTQIDTGNAGAVVSVSNAANINKADLGGCNSCTTDPSSVIVSGNGFDSLNRAKVTTTNNQQAFQTNNANFTNNISTNSNSGNNRANFNTGGNVGIATGNAGAAVNVQNMANANIVSQNGGVDGGSGFFGGPNAEIAGNGAFSDNAIKLRNNNNNSVVQNNNAWFNNNIKTKSNTGNNVASFNTGGFFDGFGFPGHLNGFDGLNGNGSTFISTGDAYSQVGVGNRANFNAADLNSCGCAFGNGTDAIISGNGSGSFNNFDGRFNNDASLFGTNNGNFNNFLNPFTTTGWNNSNWNTSGWFGGNNSLLSGSSLANTSADNVANVNQIGNGFDAGFPGFFGFGIGN